METRRVGCLPGGSHRAAGAPRGPLALVHDTSLHEASRCTIWKGGAYNRPLTSCRGCANSTAASKS
eukprot:9397182-Pyramimonas_sp.AAC.1